jgi:hypothetical protein
MRKPKSAFYRNHPAQSGEQAAKKSNFAKRTQQLVENTGACSKKPHLKVFEKRIFAAF